MSELTVVVCTLNEEQNIVPCLNSLGWDGPLIVVDGGSTDRTVELVGMVRPDATVLVQTGGLLKQRVRGVGAVRTPLLAFVDADDRLEPKAIKAAIEHLRDRDLCAVQLGFGTDRTTAVSTAYSGMLQASHPVGMRLGMLGRPCVIWADKLPTDPDSVPVVYPMEDAWLHATYLSGCTVEVAPANTVRLQPSTLREVLSKTWAYGLGDAEQSAEFRRWPRTIFHLLIRYPVIRAARAVRHGHLTAALMCVAVGWVRFTAAAVHTYRSNMPFGRMRSDENHDA